MAYLVPRTPVEAPPLPTFVASTPAPAQSTSSVSSSRPCPPPSSCGESPRGTTALALYEGRITGRGGAKESFHCTTTGSVPPPHRTTPRRLASSASSSSLSSTFDPARLDCLRRHEALRRKREEHVQATRAREDMARKFKAPPLPPIHRGASIDPDSNSGDDGRGSAFSPTPYCSSPHFGSTGPAFSSSCSRHSSTKNTITGAGSSPSSSWRRRADSSRAARESRHLPSPRENNDDKDDFGRSTHLFEDGSGLLQRQREWAEVRARRLEAARAVKAVEEVAELRPIPDLAEARLSWERAKAEHEEARLRALEREKERQELEALKQQVVRARYQGMYGHGAPRRGEQEGGGLRLHLPRPRLSEEGQDQGRRRSPSRSPLRPGFRTPSRQTNGMMPAGQGQERHFSEHRDSGNHHDTTISVASRHISSSPFEAIVPASSPVPYTPPGHTLSPATPAGASPSSSCSTSSSLRHRSPSNAYKRQGSSLSASPSPPGQSSPSLRPPGSSGGTFVIYKATPTSRLPPSPPRPPSSQLPSSEPFSDDPKAWNASSLPMLDLSGELGKLYAEVGQELSLLYTQDIGGGRQEGGVLRRSSSSSSSGSGSSLERSWERRRLVLEEDVLLARLLNRDEEDGKCEQEEEREEK